VLRVVAPEDDAWLVPVPLLPVLLPPLPPQATRCATRKGTSPHVLPIGRYLRCMGLPFTPADQSRQSVWPWSSMPQPR
jgi:hypothetical protein